MQSPCSLAPSLLSGETLQERESGETEKVLATQLEVNRRKGEEERQRGQRHLHRFFLTLQLS